MCDERTAKDDAAHLSRREFATVTAAAAIAGFALPAGAAPLAVVEREVEIATADGKADAYFVHPARGRHPAVLIWPDIVGLRATFRAMGKRLAEAGYAVLVVNPFYRAARAPVVPEGSSFQDPAIRAKLIPMAQALNITTVATDAKAFVGFLDAQKAVDTKRGIGTTGYCMGGAIVMGTAASQPDRIRAGASFHGGGLATDRPTSPHLLVPQMKAGFLIAIAANDDEQEPQAKTMLREAFDKAKLPAEIEVYAGALHGWCVPGSPVYNQPQAEKAWARMLALFEKQLA